MDVKVDIFSYSTAFNLKFFRTKIEEDCLDSIDLLRNLAKKTV